MKQGITFSIQGMHCTSCAMNIDGELEDIPGVISSQTSYAKQKTEVLYEEDQVSEQKIQTVIQSLSYTATVQSKKSIE